MKSKKFLKVLVLAGTGLMAANAWADLACIQAASAWVRPDASPQNRRDVALLACRGGTQATRVAACLQSVWEWTTGGSDDHRRLVAAQACSGDSDPVIVRACLDRAWAWLESGVDADHGRRVVSIACGHGQDPATVAACLQTGWDLYPEIADRNERRLAAAGVCQADAARDL
jgi:hypothetical protein